MLGTARRLISILSVKSRRRLFLALLGSVVAAMLEALGVAAVLPLLQLVTGGDQESGVLGRIDDALGGVSETTLAVAVSVGVLVVFLTRAAYSIAFRWWLAKFLAEEEAATAVTLLRRFLAAPYWVHLQRNTASFVRSMSDAVGQTYGLVLMAGITALTEVVSVVAIATVLVVLNPLPAITLVAYFVVLSLVYERVIRGPATRAGEQLQQSSLAMNVFTWQALGATKEIRVRRTSGHFVDRYASARADFTRSRRTASFLNDLPRSLFEIAFIIAISLLTVLTFLTKGPGEGLASLGLFVAAGFRLLPSLTRIVASGQNVRLGSRGVQILLDDMTDQFLQDTSVDDPGNTHRRPLKRTLEVRDVFYRYPGSDRDVLVDISLTLRAGQSLALVGVSGAGKSTLADVILGLHVPQSGEVVVDGVSILEDLPGWQRSIGMVPQDIYLVDDTIRANIAFGDPPDDDSERRLHEAIASAQLTELVDSLPQGVDTETGERGARLSGGQRQRLGIARALYHNPDVLVLDEATSALDTDTERRIAETVAALTHKVTTIIIAHRLSTVRSCDQVAFLSQGRLVALGSFEEVRQRAPEFAHLVSLGSLDPHTLEAASPIGSDGPGSDGR